MNSKSFRATIEKVGGRTLIPLPFNPDDVWGVKQRHHVTGVIDGRNYRGPLGSDGKMHYISLGEAWLRDARLAAGAEVDATLSPEGPQTEQLADDIAAALDANPQARACFESLATFYRKKYLTWIQGAARRPEVRAERIKEMLRLLNEGKKER